MVVHLSGNTANLNELESIFDPNIDIRRFNVLTVSVLLLFQNFTSGFSNTLFGYYEEGKFSEDVVLFRIHNESTKHLTDRKQEGKTMQARYSFN